MIEIEADLKLMGELTEGLKDLKPVQVAIVLTESSRIIIWIGLPLECLRFVHLVLLQWVTCLVCFEHVVSDACLNAFLS